MKLHNISDISLADIVSLLYLILLTPYHETINSSSQQIQE